MGKTIRMEPLGPVVLGGDERPWTVREAAVFLGVSEQTVYLWVEGKKIRKRPSWTVLTDCCRWGSVRMRAIDLIGEDVFFQRFLNGLVEADQQLDQAFAFTPLQHG